MSEPRHHHYLPIFYLKRWCNSDGEICRFDRPHGRKLKTHYVVPKGTGYEVDLYTIPGVATEGAQAMEKQFMAPIDDDAAKALEFLENHPSDRDWPTKLRSSWSRFLTTQLMRAPEDVEQMKSSIAEEWAKLDPSVIADRAGKTLEEVLAQQGKESPEEIERQALRILRSLMDHSGIGQVINDMVWSCIEIPPNAYALLTSDRPVWATATLSEADAMISMPVGPKRLFVARRSSYTQLRSTADLAKGANRLVVTHARRYVYGADDLQFKFVEKHMSKIRTPSLLGRLARHYGNTEV